MPLFFWFELSLEARAEISVIFSLLFWDKRLFHKDILKLSDLYKNQILVTYLTTIRYIMISKKLHFVGCATVGSKSDVTLYQGNRIRVKHNEHKSCRRLLKTVLQVETCFVTRRPAEWLGNLMQGQLQEWTEYSHTDLWKFETSRDNQKIISTSFEHLKCCINFQN